MYQPTIFTWILVVFGLVTCLPLLFAQIIILKEPKGKLAKDILIGKGEEWRDKSHFKAAYAAAWADWIIFMPFFVLGMIGVLAGHFWGYLFYAASGAIQLYINVFLWFFEKEYVYPSQGPLKYYTYYWGNFIYWGLAAVLHSIYRLAG